MTSLFYTWTEVSVSQAKTNPRSRHFVEVHPEQTHVYTELHLRQQSVISTGIGLLRRTQYHRYYGYSCLTSSSNIAVCVTFSDINQGGKKRPDGS